MTVLEGRFNYGNIELSNALAPMVNSTEPAFSNINEDMTVFLKASLPIVATVYGIVTVPKLSHP